MKGERKCWFLLALKLHKTVGEVQSAMTSSEFMDWLTYLRMEREEENSHPTREHYYLARFTMFLAAIYNLLIQKKQELKVDDFLLKFEGSVETAKVLPEKEIEHIKQQELIKSKSAWAGFLTPFMKKKDG